MRKTTQMKLITIISLLTVTTSVSAQHLYLHYDNGEVLYLGKDNVDSITFSNYDADSVYHDKIVTQVIHTNHTKYQIPISFIDSISCVNQDKSYTTCPDGNHPHMIDLGLPSGTKWACCNVGASRPEGLGGYYAWGELEEKSVYDYSTYQHIVLDNENGLWWFNGDYYRAIDIGESICGTKYDVARMKWRGSWKMPSREQMGELCDNSKTKWIELKGVEGLVFTGPKGNSIFLPAAGIHYETEFTNLGRLGYYWSGTGDTNIHYYNVYFLLFGDDGGYPDEFGDINGRFAGLPVRPVSK